MSLLYFQLLIFSYFAVFDKNIYLVYILRPISYGSHPRTKCFTYSNENIYYERSPFLTLHIFEGLVTQISWFLFWNH